MQYPTRFRLPSHFYVVLFAAILLAAGAGTLGGYLAGANSESSTQIVEYVSEPAAEPRQIATQFLEEEPDQIQDVIERSLPAVVTIFGLSQGDFPSEGGTPRGPVSAGSGFFFNPDGFLLTNNHVINDRENLRVILSNGEFKRAEVIGRDPYMDTAILKVDGGPFPILPLGDSTVLRAGDTVLAIGSPLRNFEGSVSKGIVSGMGRRFPNRVATEFGDLRIDLIGMIQTDAALNSGNSGGPLLNRAGQVVGMNTGREDGSDGIGFAIPMAHIKQHLNALVTEGRTQHGYLGVSFRPVDEDIVAQRNLTSDRGAYIAEVVADSTAKAAGIQAGDIILAINGDSLRHGFELGEKVFAIAVGDTVEFTVDRDGERLILSAPLQPRPEPVGLE